MKSGTKEVKLMYLDSIFNLSMLEEIAPEMVRHNLIHALADLYSGSPDPDIVRSATRILDNLVIEKNHNIHCSAKTRC